jgi:hypothetical protein
MQEGEAARNGGAAGHELLDLGGDPRTRRTRRLLARAGGGEGV